METKRVKEPFPGAYFLGLAITLLLLYLVLAVGSSLPPGLAGFGVAFLLGLTVNPKYAPYFLAVGLVSVPLGFAADEAQVAWGGVGLSLAELLLLLWARSKR